METTKRVYAKPTILKVQLNHEQAVLGICSTSATSISDGANQKCRNASPKCRKGPSCPPCPAPDSSPTS